MTVQLVQVLPVGVPEQEFIQGFSRFCRSILLQFNYGRITTICHVAIVH
jgi:hypothetical protein